MTSKFIKQTAAGLLSALMLAGGFALSAQAADIKLRATANSNENDEDYDGLIVFKDFVESRSNGAIEVELFIGTQLCSNGAECLQGIADGTIDIYISTSGDAAGDEGACRSYIGFSPDFFRGGFFGHGLS